MPKSDSKPEAKATSQVVEDQARVIADKMQASDNMKVGFDPFTIISRLLPILSQLFQGCQQPSPTPQAPKEFLEDHWDETTQTFDQSLINRTRPHTRRASRQAGHPKMSREDLDNCTVATLTEGRTADDATVSAVMSGTVS